MCQIVVLFINIKVFSVGQKTYIANSPMIVIFTKVETIHCITVHGTYGYRLFPKSVMSL